MIEASVPLMCSSAPDEDSGAVGGAKLDVLYPLPPILIAISDIYPSNGYDELEVSSAPPSPMYSVAVLVIFSESDQEVSAIPFINHFAVPETLESNI